MALRSRAIILLRARMRSDVVPIDGCCANVHIINGALSGIDTNAFRNM
jgi:hypothetical protein